jgi:hypothetical protein
MSHYFSKDLLHLQSNFTHFLSNNFPANFFLYFGKENFGGKKNLLCIEGYSNYWIQ